MKAADGTAITVHQPQVERWADNNLAGRAAVSVRAPGAKEPSYGVIELSARTEIDKSSDLVTLSGLRLTKASFPGAAEADVQKTLAALRGAVKKDRWSMSAQALQANLERGFLEGEEQYRQILEGLSDVVFLTNASGTRVLYVNAAFEEVWGRPRAMLYSDPLALLAGVHPDDRPRVSEAMAACPTDSCEHEYRVVRPAGDVRWVWSRCYPVFDRDGRLYRFGNIIEDVTEKRQIIESHERLVRGFTHDIKNPLGATDGYLALLEMGIHGQLGSPQEETVHRARRSIRAALDLVVQLLDIERAQSGQLDLRREHVDLEGVTSVADPHARGGAPRVLAGVGECLLDDPVRRHVERRRRETDPTVPLGRSRTGCAPRRGRLGRRGSRPGLPNPGRPGRSRRPRARPCCW